MKTKTQFTKGQKVRLADATELQRRLSGRVPREGQTGTVIALRPLIDDSALVKFNGFRGLISVHSNDLEAV